MDVFISYARSASKNEARALKDALKNSGIEVFLDEVEIPAGSSFPLHLADALCASRIVVIFADETYFSKPWCIYEFKVCIAPCSQIDKNKLNDDTCNHIIIALPETGNVGNLVDHLPLPLKEGAWLKCTETDALADQVIQRLKLVQKPMVKRFEGLDDDAVNSLRNGALINAASKLPRRVKYLPSSLKEKFVGRADKLWEIFSSLETKAGQELSRSVVIEGSAGMGKTQLATEYVWRYGNRHYLGGIIWINADCDEKELQQQFSDLMESYKIVGHSSDKGNETSIERDSELIADYFSNRPADQSVLWIIDNVPEPRTGEGLKPLSYWCPAKENVSLLCTSRQATIKNIDSIILLSELTIPAAIELITQPPVKKPWFREFEWETIVRWVGCWPMGLRILHASLSDSLITHEVLLSKAKGNNPSPVLDDTVQALQGFVEEGYVKGVSELFKFSYDELKNYPDAFLGAHVMARLARIPLPENLLAELLPGNAIAILGKRHWIEVSDKTDDKYSKSWLMHRVIASFFKSMSSREEEEFRLIIEWLRKLFSPDSKWENLKILENHFRVVAELLFSWLYKNQNSVLVDEARKLAVILACFQLHNFNARGLRFTAAGLANRLGVEHWLIEIYEEQYFSGDTEKQQSIVYCLRALTSARSAQLLASTFSNGNDKVRWQAFHSVSNSNVDILAMPWLDAMLKETNKNILENNAVAFDNIFDAASEQTKIGLLTRITDALRNANYDQQKFLISLLGRLILFFGKSFSVGSFSYASLIDRLLKIALESANEDVAKEAANNLANEFDDGVTLQHLLNAVSAQQETDKILSTFNIAATYIEGLARPKPPKNISAVFTEEGGLKLDLQFGDEGKNIVPFYRPFVSFASTIHDEQIRGEIIDKIGSRKEGLVAIQEEINSLIDQAKWYNVKNIAESVLSKIPVFKVNGYWWRGQAFSSLDYANEAIKDYTEVIQLAPTFSEARRLRVLLLYKTNNYLDLKTDLEFYLKEEPENWKFMHDLGYCLFNLKEYDKSLDYLQQCVKLNDKFASAWYLISYANYYLSHISTAIEDIDIALSLEPQNNAFKEFKDYLSNVKQEGL